jgi:outer membrane protein assembly factor BamB
MYALLLAAALDTQWPTFAHDDRRTGFQTASPIRPDNVKTLKLRWSRALGETPRVQFTSSPIVVNGVVYVASRGGWLYALNTADGSTRWRRHIGSDIRMTPAYINGRLLVGVYGVYPPGEMFPHGASIQSLNPANGDVFWKAEFPGVERSDPIVVNGVVYVGTAGGDADSGGTNGRVLTFDERTGKPLKWTWSTTPVGHAGGGIWSPFSYDGGLIFFGTGDTTDSSGNGNSAIAVTPELKTVWALSERINHGDEDNGSGVSIFGDTFYSASKAGFIYAYDRQTGKLKWKQDLHPDGIGGGGHGTPSGDGTVITRNTGDGSSEPPYKTKLLGFDLDGRRLWSIDGHEMAAPWLGSSFVRGIGFAGIDRSLVAFGARTGEIVWKYDTPDFFYAVPAIVGDSVYTVDMSGNVLAFSLGAATVHAEQLVVPPPPPPQPMSKKRMLAIGGVGVLGFLGIGALYAVRSRRRRVIPQA